MQTETLHKHLIQTGAKPVFHPPAIAQELVETLRRLTAKPWRIIEIKHDHYARPVILGYSPEFTVKIGRTWPETARADASIISTVRPQHHYDLPHLPKCSFDPTRTVEAIAKELVRKLVERAAEPVKAWRERVELERKKDNDAADALRRIRSMLQMAPTNKKTDGLHFEIGPFRLRVDGQSGQISTYTTAYVHEDDLKKLIDVFGLESQEPKP